MIYKCTRKGPQYWPYCRVSQNTFEYFDTTGEFQVENDGTQCLHVGKPPRWYEPLEVEIAKKIITSYES